MRTIIVLAHAFPPRNLSGAARPARFCKYLPKFGYDPQVVSELTVKQTGGLVRLRTRALEVAESLIQRYRERTTWAPGAVKQARELASRHQARAILSTAPPFGTHLAALMLKGRTGLPWVADFRDPLYGNTSRTGRLGCFYDRQLEGRILEHADAVIANTDEVGEMLCRRYPAFADKVTVIWNGYDPEEKLPPRTGKRNRIPTLAHTGDLYGQRYPGVLLRSLERLSSAGAVDLESLRVLLIGTVASNSPLHDDPCFQRLRAKGVVQCDGQKVPRARSLEAIVETDYLLLLDITGDRRSVQVPAKIFDYIRGGRPILAFTTKGSPTERILNQSGIRTQAIYTDDEEAQVDRKVNAFLKAGVTDEEPSEWFWNTFNGERQTKELAGIFDRIIEG